MAKKKKKEIISVADYKERNGTVVTAGDYRQMSAATQRERARQQEQEKKAKQEKLTKFFQDSAAHEQNQRKDGTAPNTYAAKMMRDSHYDLNAYLKGLAEKKTAANKKLAQDATYMDGGKGEPGLAYQAVMMGADADKTRTNLNKYLQSTKERALELTKKGLNRPPRQEDSKEGYDAFADFLKQTTNQSKNKYGIDTYKGYRQSEQDEIDLGRKQTSDLWKMRDEDLEIGKNRYGRRADEYTEKAKKLAEDKEKRAGWKPELAGSGDIYDFV